jgi:hypothetical protein
MSKKKILRNTTFMLTVTDAGMSSLCRLMPFNTGQSDSKMEGACNELFKSKPYNIKNGEEDLLTARSSTSYLICMVRGSYIR